MNKTEPHLESKALLRNRVPASDIVDLRVRFDRRGAMNWWVVCNSRRAKCQLTLCKCLQESDATATVAGIEAAIQGGKSRVNVDDIHVHSVVDKLCVGWAGSEGFWGESEEDGDAGV